ncbi:unnamed protein product [Rotaria sordida]|uniref:NHL repeat-containing protein n=1 Tax=Rotaria sordida TaxID=392033 RepID=A0A819F5U9_9BILA|nr:unnamed protein product [Rotaria sordida]
MSSSFLEKEFLNQIDKENQLNDKSKGINTIQSMLDPRFHSIINRSKLFSKTNQIHPKQNSKSSNINSNPITNSISKNALSSTCKSRLQGLLIGLGMTVITLAILLAVFLTRSSSTTTTSTTSTCNTLSWNSTGITIIGNGSNGFSLNQLNNPGDVFIGNDDTIYIADTSNHRILSINISSINNGTYYGNVIAGITNTPGTTSQTLKNPKGIYVDSDKNLYIADTNNCRVQYWRYGSSNGSTVAGNANGSPGAALDKLSQPYAVYVDQSKNIYVSDTGNGRIVQWISGNSSGILVTGNASSGFSSNQLALPVDIIVDSQNQIIYIANFNAHTIVSWTIGKTAGTILLGTNSTKGNSPSLFQYPFGLIRDTYGNLYVSDLFNHRVQMFCLNGTSFSSGKVIAGTGISQFSSIDLSFPSGIAFDSQMNLYVADSGNHRIQKFSRIQ